MIKKVCMLGDANVGKTSLIRRFVLDTFSDDYLSTIGAKVTEKNLELTGPRGRVLLHMVIWDIAGQKEFSSVKHSLFQGGEGALVVADLTRRTTLENASQWVHAFRSTCGEQPFVLLTNKWDLLHRKDFELADAEKMAAGYDSPHFPSSAKTGENVEKAFRALGQAIVARMR